MSYRALFAVCAAVVGFAAVCGAGSSLRAASIYSQYVIDQTNPAIYWDLDETSGTIANDTAPLNGFTTGNYLNTSSSNAVGPRPVDGFYTMNPNNVGGSTNLSGKVLTTVANTGAGVGTAAYSAGIWFNSTNLFTSQVLNYVIERGNDATVRRDSVGVGGNWGGGTIPNVMFGVSGSNVVNGSTVLSPNTWYHALLVRDDSLPTQKFKIYLNGGLELSGNFSWDGGLGEYIAAANRVDNHNGLGLVGNFDEFAVWNYALSAEEALLVYETAITPINVLFPPAPEPSSIVLLGLGALVLTRRRRRER